MKKILFITLAAIGLSFLASSCVKEKGFEERVNEIVAAQLDSLNKQVAALEKTQAALNDSLKNVKGDVEKLSKQSKSLTDSISAVKDSLAAQKKWTTEQLNAIGVKITDIEKAQEEFMADVYTRLGHLWNRIQKIDVVPQYSDGSVYVGKTDTVVNFIVRPDSVAQKLVKAHTAGDSTFTFLAVKTISKSTANADADTVHLDVKGVSYENGIVSVKVNGSRLPDAYFEGTQSYNARLKIADGNSDNTSGFFPLYYVVPAEDLSANGTSNCYIVSKAGDYMFKATVKGNCADSVITPSAVSVLWESFGTSEKPDTGSLVNNISLADGYVNFTASSKKGNAVIAVKAINGTDTTILWSWHIWCTDQPAEQEYNNSAGFMMDRNLGATSAEKGQVGALGLLYQWGRKDPFLGGNGITGTTQAASTLATWPTVAAGSTGESPNNLSYSIKNPTTFIKNSSNPLDWYCTSSGNGNDSLWNVTSGKTIYDPCPVGYRVPKGGKNANNGVWAKAFNDEKSFTETTGFSNGLDFGQTSKKLVGTGSDQCWYPAAGFRSYSDGLLASVGYGGTYWSCTPNSDDAYYLYFYNVGSVSPSISSYRAHGMSVRCIKITE